MLLCTLLSTTQPSPCFIDTSSHLQPAPLASASPICCSENTSSNLASPISSSCLISGQVIRLSPSICKPDRPSSILSVIPSHPTHPNSAQGSKWHPLCVIYSGYSPRPVSSLDLFPARLHCPATYCMSHRFKAPSYMSPPQPHPQSRYLGGGTFPSLSPAPMHVQQTTQSSPVFSV